MARGYFSHLPNINYVSRTTDRSSNDEFIPVKNLFKRGKLRDDLASVFTAFNDYVIGEDIRPEMIALELYGDPRLDWIILTVNNIISVRDEWPLGTDDFRKFLLDKYGSDEKLAEVHHYETTYMLDNYSRIVIPNGLKVDSNYDFNFVAYNAQYQQEISYSGGLANTSLPPAVTIDDKGTAKDASGNTILNKNIKPVSNLEYETDINNGKRRIKVLKLEYVDVVYNDMKRIFKYKNSSQYKTPYMKESHNPRLSGA
tara:strand:- start:513 stop:1280 length:768 start_codon:yes stop_codon:yes gene_type:complete